MSNSRSRPATPRWVVALTVAVAALALSQSAFAANFTASQITSPGDNTFVQYTTQAPNTLHVTGSIFGGSSNADIACYWGTQRTVVAQNVQVVDGGFSADVSLNLLTQIAPSPYCVLRAVPVGDITSYPPNIPSAFAGPRIGAGRFQPQQTGGKLTNYFLSQGQARGYMDYNSAGSCGLDYSFVFDPVTLDHSYPLFYCNGYLWSRNGSSSTTPTQVQATGSELKVDGVGAYLPHTASALYYIDPSHKSSLIDGIPELSLEHSIDPANGNVHISEAGAAVRCAPNAAAFHVSASDPAWATDCTSFSPVGVKLERTIAGDQGGRRTTMTDVWSSTDGQSHELDVDYEEDFSGSLQAPSPSFGYSWIDSQQAPASAGTTIDGPAGDGPATVFADGNGEDANQFVYPQGAVTYAPAPDDIRWIYSSGAYATGLWRFARTIPAGGSLKIVHIYTDGSSPEEVFDQAAADREQAAAPAVAIWNPNDGSTLASPAVTVTGAATDPGGTVKSVAVNGAAADLAPDGTWSKSIVLAPGENTISVVARDAVGNEGTASAKVTYSPAPPTNETPGAGGGATDTDTVAPVLGLSIARVRLGAFLKTGLPVTASCSEACSFKLTLTIGSRVARQVGLGTRALAIGVKSDRLAARGSTKVTVKLSRKARRKLASVKGVRVKVTLTAADAARNAARKATLATIRR